MTEAMKITLSTQPADARWGEKATYSINNDGITLHLNGADDLGLIQRAARKIDGLGIKHVQLSGEGKCQRPGNRCRAAHVRLHRVHKRSLFDAVAAGVKSDTFTYQARVHWRFFIASWVVIQRQQYRRTF